MGVAAPRSRCSDVNCKVGDPKEGTQSRKIFSKGLKNNVKFGIDIFDRVFMLAVETKREEHTMKINNHVTKAEARTIERMVRRCMKLLRKKEYELNLPSNAADVAVRCLEVKRRNGSPSRGGRDLIRINLGYWQVGNAYHTEYASFDDHPVIGRIRCYTPEDHYLVTVAHEVAHHVQYRYGSRIPRFAKMQRVGRKEQPIYKKPHGKAFQDIYAYLRRDLVNPLIEQRNIERLQREADERWENAA